MGALGMSQGSERSPEALGETLGTLKGNMGTLGVSRDSGRHPRVLG